MDDAIMKAVLRVVESMQTNLGEQLTIDDMARIAMFSKFHFSRVFQRVTGLSPGRFLSAVRLREAKRLLSTTTLTVTDISHRVGYSSVGTFSSRFTSSVGVSPSRYRQLAVPRPPTPTKTGAPGATVRGTVSSPVDGTPVFAGLFPDRIVEGWPASHTIIRAPGPFVLGNVPEGRWHLIAQSVAEGREDAFNLPATGDGTLCVGRHGPITVRAGDLTEAPDLRLRPMKVYDPPVLFALHRLLSAEHFRADHLQTAN